MGHDRLLTMEQGGEVDVDLLHGVAHRPEAGDDREGR